MDTKIIGDRPHHQYNSPLIAYLEMSTLSVFILFILSSFLSESGCPGFTGFNYDYVHLYPELV